MFEQILDRAQAKGGLLTKQNRQKIKDLYLKGYSTPNIRDIFKNTVSRSTIDRAITEMTTGLGQRGEKVDSPVKITKQELKQRSKPQQVSRVKGYLTTKELIDKFKQKGISQYYADVFLNTNMASIAKRQGIKSIVNPDNKGAKLYKEPTEAEYKKILEKVKPKYSKKELDKASQLVYGKNFDDLPSTTELKKAGDPTKNPRSNIARILRRNQGKAPTSYKKRQSKLNRIPLSQDFFSEILPKYSAADLKKDLRKGKNYVEIANEQFEKNKKQVLNKLKGTPNYLNPNRSIQNSLRSKILFMPELEELHKKNIKAVGSKRYTKRQYAKDIEAMIPLAQEQGLLPEKLDSGKKLNTAGRYFTYVRQKQINPIQKLFSYTQKMGVEHPFGIKRSMLVSDPSTLAKVVPLLDQRNARKGILFDAPITSQVRNVLAAKTPMQRTKNLAALNKLLTKSAEIYKIPKQKYVIRNNQLVPTGPNIKVTDDLIKNARVAVNQYIDLGGQKIKTFKDLDPNLQTAIKAFEKDDTKTGNSFLRKALKSTKAAALAPLILTTYVGSQAPQFLRDQGILEKQYEETAGIGAPIVEKAPSIAEQAAGAATAGGATIGAAQTGLGKKVLKAGGRFIGPAFVGMSIYDTGKALQQGKGVVQSLEEGILGTGLTKAINEYRALSPEGKEAFKTISQAKASEDVLYGDFARPVTQQELEKAQGIYNIERGKALQSIEDQQKLRRDKIQQQGLGAFEDIYGP